MRWILACCFGFSLSFSLDIYASFDVFARHSADLVFQTSGIVKEIKTDVSSVVKKGDVLVVLDSTDEQIALQNAKNDLKIAALSKNLAKDTFDKFMLVKNEISNLEFNKVEFEYNSAVLAETKASLAVKNLQNQISKKSLKAPFDGIITAKNVDIGSGVLALNSKVVSINSYPSAKLILKIDEKYIDEVRVGDEFVFKFDSDNKTKRAIISLIHPTIDINTKKFLAEVYVDDIVVGRYGEGYISTKR